MYETKCTTRKINGVDIETWSRDIIDANVLTVEAGTNGYRGGGTKCGSRTYIRIEDKDSMDPCARAMNAALGIAGTDFRARVITAPDGRTSGIEMVLGGDAALSTIIEALEFSAKVLRDQIEEAELD